LVDRIFLGRKCFSILMVLVMVLASFSPMAHAEAGGNESQGTMDTTNLTVDPSTQIPAEPPQQTTSDEASPTDLTTNIVNSEANSASGPAALATQATGTLVNGVTPLANVIFSIHTLAAEPAWYDFQTNENGEFFYQLPDGKYQIDGIWLEPKWYELNQQFTIQNGQIVESSKLVIDVANEAATPAANLAGILVNGSVPLPGITFSIHSNNSETWYDTTTTITGEFSFTLPDGNYQLDGIWLPTEGKWYELNQTFKMVGGQLDGALKLTINIASTDEEANFTGTLKKGTQPIAGTVFSLRRTSGTEQWYDLQTDATGSFRTKLPDGNYHLEGVWIDSEQKWYVLKLQITLNGQLNLPINLESMPAGNVSGLLTKGQAALPNTIFSIRSTTSGAWYDTKSNESGYFDIQLPDGDYLLEGVWVEAEQKWYELKKSFNVQNHVQLDIDILSSTQPIQPNVKGVLKKGNMPLANVIFSLHSLTPEPVWYDATTDATGKFQFTLPDGDYQIVGIWDPTETKWYELNQTFTVVNGHLSGDTATLTVQVGMATDYVTGTVRDSNGVIPYAQITYYSVSKRIYQEFHTDAAGNFSIQLEDDEYHITGIETKGTYNPVDILFSIQDGMLFIDGVNTLSLTLTIPAITVEANLYDAEGKIVQDSRWLHVTNETGERFNSEIIAGKASFRLADGNYQVIYSFSRYSQIPIGQSFSLENGEIFINGEKQAKLELRLHPITLTGQIFDGGTILPNSKIVINKGPVPNDDSSGFYMTTSDENGFFQLGLQDGVYYVDSVNANNSLVSVGTTFEIIEGKLLVNGVNQDVLTIKLHPVTLKGTVTVEGYPNDRVGMIHVKNIGTSQTYYTYTDMYGDFEMRLPNGSYKTYSVELEGIDTIAHYQSFDIVNGKLQVAGKDEERLLVKVPALTKVNGHLEQSSHDTTPIKGLYIRMNGQEFIFYKPIQTDRSFEFLGQDGNYEVAYVNDHEDQMIPVKMPFQIINGKLVVNGLEQTELLVKLLPVTLKGKVILPDDLAAQEVYVETINQATNTSYNTWTTSSYGLRLPDGDYKVTRVFLDLAQQWLAMDISFTIRNGKLLIGGVEQSELTVRVPALVKAEVSYAYQTSDKQVYFEIRNQNDKLVSTIWSNAEGKFSLRLPDGEYRIIHAYRNDLKKWVLMKPYLFKVAEGKIYANGVPVSVLPIKMEKVEFVSGRVVEGGLPWANATVRVKLDEIYSGVIPVATDANGYFTIPLQDGKFKVTNVTKNQETVAINMLFDVMDGKVFVKGEQQDLLVLEVPPVNFKGTVVNDAGLQLSNVSFWIDGDFDSGNFQWVNTDADGKFSIRLVDDKYRITLLFLPDIQQPIMYDFRFTIQNGKMIVAGEEKSSVTLSVPKLHSIPVHMEKNGTPITNGGVMVGIKNLHYIRVTYQNENGDFHMILEDGVYEINSLEQYGQNVSIQPIEFEIKNGKILINGTEQPKINIK
jgi:hypothetical protein